MEEVKKAFLTLISPHASANEKTAAATVLITSLELSEEEKKAIVCLSDPNAGTADIAFILVNTPSLQRKIFG